MQGLTGGQIRKEYDIIQEALKDISLNEKFIAASDPSVIIGEALEELEKSLAKIRAWYNKNAGDRNVIVKQVQRELQEVISGASKAIKDLANSEPEDTNRKIG